MARSHSSSSELFLSLNSFIIHIRMTRFFLKPKVVIILINAGSSVAHYIYVILITFFQNVEVELLMSAYLQFSIGSSYYYNEPK